MTKDHNSPLQLEEKINLKISFRLMWKILQRRQREIKKNIQTIYYICIIFYVYLYDGNAYNYHARMRILDEMTNG